MQEAAEQIERVLLGACLLEDEETLERLVSVVRPAYFSLDAHKRIGRCIVGLYRQHRPVNIVSVSQELTAKQEIEACGGVSYLASLTEGLPLRLAESAQEHIDRLTEFWRKRELIRLFEYMASASVTEASLEIIQEAMRRLEGIVADTSSDDNHVSAYTVSTLDNWIRERDNKGPVGLSWGIPKLDEATRGLMPGYQTAVGANSGVGKTTVLAQVLFANCSKGIPCHAFLLEPTRQQVLGKLWSLVANVRYGAVSHPVTATKEESEKLQWAAGVVAEWPLRLDDKGLDLDKVMGLARVSMSRHGTRLIALDYIQRLKVHAIEKDEQTRLKVGRASTALADLVKNTNCHSLLFSQLTTGRKDGPKAMPTMFDFRESSQIENDAHTIVLLHREYEPNKGRYTDKGAILVPKQRFGVPCNLTATFDSRLAIWMGTEGKESFE